MRTMKDDLKSFNFRDYNMFMCVIVCHGDVAGNLMDASR